MATTEEVLKPASDANGSPLLPVAPWWMAYAPPAAMLWALAYGAVRVRWAFTGAPSFGRLGFDLVYFTGWRAVGLCAVAACLALALWTARWWWPLVAVVWAVCAAHLVACPLLLLDMVGGLLPHSGVQFIRIAFLSRAACLVQGILLGASAVAYRRRWRSDCLFCGRTGEVARRTQTPRWAWWAAYLAVAGCLVRIGAQIAVGFGMLRGFAVFEAGFLLAGTVLPLALVHSWGRVVPRWMPLLAGRRVPRWLPLAPGFAFGGLMTVYFGFTFVMIAAGTLNGTWKQHSGSFPLAFFWVAVPAYLIWGLGLITAAIACYQVTRPLCRVCGR